MPVIGVGLGGSGGMGCSPESVMPARTSIAWLSKAVAWSRSSVFEAMQGILPARSPEVKGYLGASPAWLYGSYSRVCARIALSYARIYRVGDRGNEAAPCRYAEQHNAATHCSGEEVILLAAPHVWGLRLSMRTFVRRIIWANAERSCCLPTIQASALVRMS